MFKLKDTGYVCTSAGDAFLEPKHALYSDYVSLL